jgi:hypothetical protein
MANLPSTTFCVFPFTHLVIHNGGSYGPCCLATEHVFLDGENKINTGKLHTAGISDVTIEPYGLSIPEAFNSKFMQDIRQQLLNGEKPTACVECWRAEDTNIDSKRENNNDLYLGLHSEFKGIFDYDSTEIVNNMHVRSLDLKFSNKCNLHCLMCNTGNSDMWGPLDDKMNQYLIKRDLKRDVNADDTLEWEDERHDTDLYHSTDHLVIHSDYTRKHFDSFPQKLFEEVKSLIPQLQEIQCTGGEPFVSKQFIELLEYAVETGHAEHIALEITTNGTKFVTDVMELLVHFKHIRFILSIDGMKGTYEYIRAPFKYNMLLERLKVLNEYIESGKMNVMINIAVVGMSYNLFDYHNMKEVENLFKGNRIPINLNMYIYNADNPLHVKWLPSSLLDEALSYYTTLLDSTDNNRRRRGGNEPKWFSQLQSYIKSNIPNQQTKLHNQRRMKNYTVLMDKVLNRDYHDFLDYRIAEFLDSVESDL